MLLHFKSNGYAKTYAKVYAKTVAKTTANTEEPKVIVRCRQRNPTGPLVAKQY